MEDDERRDDEEEHRRNGVARAKLEQQVLARERGDVGEVASCAARGGLVASGARRARARGCETTSVRSPAERRELAVEELAPASSRPAYGSSRSSSSGSCSSVRQSASRCCIPRENADDPLVPGLPEPEALEQHPDPLAPLGNAVEPPVEVEVLERGQLAVDERLVRRGSRCGPRSTRDLELARGGREQAGAEREQRRLAGAVRAGDDQEVPPRQRRGRGRGGRASSPKRGRGRARRITRATSASTKAKKVTLMTPFMVKNAVSSRRRPAARRASARRRGGRRPRRRRASRGRRLEPEAGERRGSATVATWQARATAKARRTPKRAGSECRPCAGRRRDRRARRGCRSPRPRPRRRRRAARPPSGSSFVIAAQAPTGASPSTAPSQKCESQVTRFRYG